MPRVRLGWLSFTGPFIERFDVGFAFCAFHFKEHAKLRVVGTKLRLRVAPLRSLMTVPILVEPILKRFKQLLPTNGDSFFFAFATAISFCKRILPHRSSAILCGKIK